MQAKKKGAVVMKRADAAETIGTVAWNLMTMRDQLKIYHWQTESHSRHVAADQLVGQISAHMDTFVETIQGKWRCRLSLPPKKKIHTLRNDTDATIVSVLRKFATWLRVEFEVLFKGHSDILNIRDELLAAVNRTLYLFSLQ